MDTIHAIASLFDGIPGELLPSNANSVLHRTLRQFLPIHLVACLALPDASCIEQSLLHTSTTYDGEKTGICALGIIQRFKLEAFNVGGPVFNIVWPPICHILEYFVS
jgi:hypothetical protein